MEEGTDMAGTIEHRSGQMYRLWILGHVISPLVPCCSILFRRHRHVSQGRCSAKVLAGSRERICARRVSVDAFPHASADHRPARQPSPTRALRTPVGPAEGGTPSGIWVAIDKNEKVVGFYLTESDNRPPSLLGRLRKRVGM